jgi:hypothetical protein
MSDLLNRPYAISLVSTANLEGLSLDAGGSLVDSFASGRERRASGRCIAQRSRRPQRGIQVGRREASLVGQLGFWAGKTRIGGFHSAIWGYADSCDLLMSDHKRSGMNGKSVQDSALLGHFANRISVTGRNPFFARPTPDTVKLW